MTMDSAVFSVVTPCIHYKFSKMSVALLRIMHCYSTEGACVFVSKCHLCICCTKKICSVAVITGVKFMLEVWIIEEWDRICWGISLTYTSKR